MNLRVEVLPQDDGSTTLHAVGELDVYTSPRLKQDIVGVLNTRTGDILLDLKLDYLDATGFGVMIGGLKRTRERGRELRVRMTGSAQRVQKAFAATGLDRIIPMVA